MSSNIRIDKVCQHCNTVFVAKTTKTNYCGLKCSSRAYKKRKREEKLGVAKSETKAIVKKSTTKSSIDVQDRHILSVSQASEITGLSSKTIYRLINSGEIIAHNFCERLTRISRTEIDRFLNQPKQPANLPSVFKKQDFFTITELQENFSDRFSKSSIYQILKKNKVSAF